jgi:hypothetical protein
MMEQLPNDGREQQLYRQVVDDYQVRMHFYNRHA